MDPKLSMHNQISSGDAEESLTLLTSRRNPRSILMDISHEFVQACEELNWNHERSTPYRSETHGIAERAVRRVKEGTSSVLVNWTDLRKASGHLLVGLAHVWDSNTTPLLLPTRFLEAQTDPFDGPMITFGAVVKCYSSVCRRPSQGPSASANVLIGQFSEYALNAGGCGAGDPFTVDTEDLKTLPHLKFTYKDWKSKEVDIQKRCNEIALQCRVGEILQEG